MSEFKVGDLVRVKPWKNGVIPGQGLFEVKKSCSGRVYTTKGRSYDFGLIEHAGAIRPGDRVQRHLTGEIFTVREASESVILVEGEVVGYAHEALRLVGSDTPLTNPAPTMIKARDAMAAILDHGAEVARLTKERDDAIKACDEWQKRAQTIGDKACDSCLAERDHEAKERKVEKERADYHAERAAAWEEAAHQANLKASALIARGEERSTNETLVAVVRSDRDNLRAERDEARQQLALAEALIERLKLRAYEPLAKPTALDRACSWLAGRGRVVRESYDAGVRAGQRSRERIQALSRWVLSIVFQLAPPLVAVALGVTAVMLTPVVMTPPRDSAKRWAEESLTVPDAPAPRPVAYGWSVGPSVTGCWVKMSNGVWVKTSEEPPLAPVESKTRTWR